MIRTICHPQGIDDLLIPDKEFGLTYEKPQYRIEKLGVP